MVVPVALAIVATILAGQDEKRPHPVGNDEIVRVRSVRVGEDWHRPVQVTPLPGADDVLVIVEQHGLVRLLHDASKHVGNADGSQPFITTLLDIRDRVRRLNWESGLHGIAFHPKYETNGELYVFYSLADPQGPFDGAPVISKFVRTRSSGRALDPDSETRLLGPIEPWEYVHYGGTLLFGPDGFLWIGLGDGYVEPCSSQDLSLPHGKILRIDVDSDEPYAIPATNPFAGNDSIIRPEIWAYGLRNPWRFSIDPQTFDIYIPDVGFDALEELNIYSGPFPGGQNYGWPVWEAERCLGNDRCSIPVPDCDETTTFEFPIHRYDHSIGRSIIGGHVYRGEDIPRLQGTYFFADFGTGRVWSIRFDGKTTQQLWERTEELTPKDGTSLRFFASFGLDSRGEMYFVTVRDATSERGRLFKIVAAP